LIELCLVQRSVPKHVKRVSIFKAFNNQLTLALNNDTPHLGLDIETTSAMDLGLAKAFAAKSHHLEHLSISYMIDAQQFFHLMPAAAMYLESPAVADTHIIHTGPDSSSSKYLYTVAKRQFGCAEDAAAQNHGALEQ
jgi:hypothetical protein